MDIVRALVTRKVTEPELAGLEVFGTVDNEGDLRLVPDSEDLLGRGWLFGNEFEVVPAGKRFRVDIWVSDEEELASVLNEVKIMGFIEDTEVQKWN